MTQSEPKPIPMILYCPQCGQQHVDEPDERTGWANPPHRSHLCHDCGCIWRPADVPTNGVAKISTRGAVDTWSAERGNAEAATPPNPSEPLVKRVAIALEKAMLAHGTNDKTYIAPEDAPAMAHAALAAIPAPADDVVEALKLFINLERSVKIDIGARHRARLKTADEHTVRCDADFRRELEDAFDNARAALAKVKHDG